MPLATTKGRVDDACQLKLTPGSLPDRMMQRGGDVGALITGEVGTVEGWTGKVRVVVVSRAWPVIRESELLAESRESGRYDLLRLTARI